MATRLPMKIASVITGASRPAKSLTHVRKCHLGYALGCKICDYRTYSGQTWLKHMKKRHSSRARTEWYATIKDEVLQGSHFELGEEVDIDEVLADAGKH